MGYKVLAFVVACFFAGMAGSFFAHFMGYISPAAFTMWLSVYILVYLLLGGQGHIFGPVLGAIFVTTLVETTRISADYQHMLFGIILMLIILVLPKGLISLVSTISKIFEKKLNHI